MLSVIFALKGIKIGSGNAFYKTPISQRYRDSKIVIGNNCCFRSDHSSNLIGVNRPCILATHKQNAVIEIGNDCGLSGTSIGASSHIKIGNKVLCGANTVITDFDWHPVAPELRHEPGISSTSPVVLEDNVWLGYGVVVLKGVTIGKNSVIAANSVVVKDIPANVIAGGNPAKVIKDTLS